MDKIVIMDKIINFKFRLWNWNKAKTKISVLWYIDARDVMEELDKRYWNWQRDHKQIWEHLFCWIGVKIDNEWIWKRDNWTESNVDKEKWESSDSFKRAAVNWGIGRFLYTLPNLYLSKDEAEANKYRVTEFVKEKYKKELKQWYDNFNSLNK